MTKQLTIIATALLLNTGIVQAQEVKTSNQAISVCKAHIKATLPGTNRVKLSKIRNKKTDHVIHLTIRNDEGSTRTVCTVNKANGAVTLKS